MDVLVKTEWTADRAGMVHWRLRTPLQFAHWGFQTLLELAVVSHIYANGAAVSPRPIWKSRPPAHHSANVPAECRVGEQCLNDAAKPVVIWPSARKHLDWYVENLLGTSAIPPQPTMCNMQDFILAF